MKHICKFYTCVCVSACLNIYTCINMKNYVEEYKLLNLVVSVGYVLCEEGQETVVKVWLPFNYCKEHALLWT